MPVPIRILFVALVGAGALAVPFRPVEAVGGAACRGVVFRDLDADGQRTETLEHDRRPDDVEPGIGAVGVVIVDQHDREHRSRTIGTGDWSIDLAASDYPIRLEFEVPAGYAAGRAGPDGSTPVQFVTGPDECDGRPLGNLGLYAVDEFCSSRPEIAVPCYVTADHEAYEEQPAIRAVSNAAVDDGSTTAASIEEWLRPDTRVIATNGEIGTVYGQAVRRDGTIYAAAFTKRHTRLTSELNPTGNPTVIYRIRPGGSPEVFATLDPAATDPHGAGGPADGDLDAMDDVFTTGVGDIELSPDESTLYAVDLGRRELVEIDRASGRIEDRLRLDGAALHRSDCNVSADDGFGDLRGFGLGWRDDTLLVGVVCSAASTVDPGRPVRESGAPGPAAGDHAQLYGYVYGFRGTSFDELLAWPLSADRGETQNNGLRSNDAAWHPWVPSYPFDAEHDAVSYPQPAITDLVVDQRGDLVIALADRWSHQTAPETIAPAFDGGTRSITEAIAAGDLQRACRRGRGWVIEGTGSCEGGVGNGWEFFDGDSYGWHAETVLGSVARLPGRAEVVVTQMNPRTGDDTWRSGGLVWHDTVTGDRRQGVRLYDGRAADPDHTFESSSGLGDLAVLCGGPPVSVGGATWHDVDADGVRDPGDGPVVGVVVELRDVDGDVLSVDVTDDHGRYSFDDGNVAGGLTRGTRYVVTLAARNHEPGHGVLVGTGPYTGLVPTAADRGDRDDLDSDAVPALPGSPFAGLPAVEVWAGDDPTTDVAEALIGYDVDFGLRDRYDLSITTSPGERTKQSGLVSFRIEVHNEGSLPSGPFEIRSNLPSATSLRTEAIVPSVAMAIEPDVVTWSFTDTQSIPPGDVRVIDLHLRVIDPTVESITNTVGIVLDTGDDADSDPALAALGEDDEATSTVELFSLAGTIWADVAPDDTERIERGLDGVLVFVLDDGGERVGATTTDESGRFLLDSFPAGTYRIAIPASEFASGGPLDRYDAVVGAATDDVGGMLADDGAVWSQPIELGPGRHVSGGVTVELGLIRRPTTPLADLVVSRAVLPFTVICVGLLLVDRRRHVGGVVTRRT